MSEERRPNAQVQKVIRESLCVRKDWVQDRLAHACFKCDKAFNSLYRRKHHCRYCGQVFCSICSNFFFPGKHLGDEDKPIRMCKACVDKCWKYIAKLDDSYIQFRKSDDVEKEPLPQNITEIQLKSRPSACARSRATTLQRLLAQSAPIPPQFLAEINTLQTILLHSLLKQAKIPLIHLRPLVQILQQITRRVPPNFVINTPMNIKEHVRIKCFLHQTFCLSLEPVVLVRKRFTSKRVKDNYENAICILIYGNIQSQDLVGGTGQASFQNMINNRLKQMNKILSYCQKIKINLIFLEGVIEKQFQDLLKKNQITVIPQVKIQHLIRLKVALRISKIVTGIGTLYEQLQKQILGSISQMTSAQYITASQKTKRFFKVSSSSDELGLLLLVESPSLDVLEGMKKIFKYALQCFVHIELRVHKLLMDHTLLQSMSEDNRRRSLQQHTEMFFLQVPHMRALEQFKEKYISYKKITYVESHFEHYPQVNKQDCQEYLTHRTHSFRNTWEDFTEICGIIDDQHRLFYSTDDMALGTILEIYRYDIRNIQVQYQQYIGTIQGIYRYDISNIQVQYQKYIGTFIFKHIFTANNKCNRCCHPNYLHSTVYYSPQQYVRIWIESRTIQQQEYSEASDVDIIFTKLQQNEHKLYCYVQCNDCQKKLTSSVHMSKVDLQYSMLRYLHHVFRSATQTLIVVNNEKKKVQMVKCTHNNKARVFRIGDRALKISNGKYAVARRRQNDKILFLKSKESSYVKEICSMEIPRIEKIALYLVEEVKQLGESCKVKFLQHMFRDPHRSFIKAKQSMREYRGPKLSQSQCIELLFPDFLEKVEKIVFVGKMMFAASKTYVQVTHAQHICLELLRKCYMLLLEIKTAIKRRDLGTKFKPEDFVTPDIQVENFDMNQLESASESSQLGDNYSNHQISLKKQYSGIQQYKEVLEEHSNVINEVHYIKTPSQTGQISNYYQQSDSISVVTSQPQRRDRADRRTEYDLGRKKKATQQEVIKIFKTIAWFMVPKECISPIYTPCFPHQLHTLISSALDTVQHRQCLTARLFYSQLTVLFHTAPLIIQQQQVVDIASELNAHCKVFHVQDRLQKGLTAEVTMVYPNEFQILRQKKGIQLDTFVSSIAGAQNWMVSGGKSGATFMKSYNDLLVIKKLQLRQFTTFRKFLPKYFCHIDEGSLLTAIYGAFTVTFNASQHFYVVMQNLCFGMKQWQMYDFKGSVTKRFSRPPVIPLDINFLVDRNSEPLFCRENVLEHLSSTLNYLCELNVIDYSLILVVQVKHTQDYYLDGNDFQVGIVDYLREFGAGERIQNIWKGPDATVVQPKNYKTRMLKNITKYFTQVPI